MRTSSRTPTGGSPRSPYTVRDHIKAVFDKAGVNSRGELVSEHLLESMTGNITHPAVVAASAS